ncbi:hypothetical protein ElyMa_003135000, partial [Elysia marginata]
IRSFSSNECFTNADQRYSLSDAVHTCQEDFMYSRFVALHVSVEAYCLLLYNSYGGCVANATSLACGPEVARYVVPLWKAQDESNCYSYADSLL